MIIKKMVKLVIIILSLTLCSLPIFADNIPVTLQIKVYNDVTGKDVPSTDFTFTIIGENGAPLPAKNSLIISNEGHGYFDPIVYTEPGTYYYTIHEQAGKVEGMDYDNAIYHLTVMVTSDDLGSLDLMIYSIKDGESTKSSEIRFINQYETTSIQKPGTVPGTGDTVQALYFMAGIFLIAVFIFLFCGYDRYRRYR